MLPLRSPRSVRRLLCTLTVLSLLLCLAASSFAEDRIATYPLLPTGYTSIKIFDRTGRFVGRILPEKRYWIPLDRIPVFLQRAVVAVEDARFFEHGGIDIRGIARALMKDVVKGHLVEGGSTITQQLIKNRYLSGVKSFDRKIEEARMAIEFEKRYTKKQILEMYLNEIYYGNGAWGIAQAARLYFDKSPEELTEGECALLAGVPKNPGRYNPMGKARDVGARRDIVLRRMADLNIISSSQWQQLRNQPITFTPSNQAPSYLSYIRNKLVERYGAGIVERGGLEVTTGMDLNLQKLAEKSLQDGVRKLSPGLQGALVSLDPVTGDLLAVVGGVDFVKNPYNRALYARRQPGSSIKPLIYAAALEKGYTAGSIWDDTPVAYDRGNGETWEPLNYGRERFGSLSLRGALAHSDNVITVKLLEAIGVPYFVDVAGRAGLSLQPENGLSLALGTNEVTLYSLVDAYTPFVDGGIRTEPRAIVRIYDRTRREWTEMPTITTPAISPAAAFITTSMLRDVLTYGTAKSLKKFSQVRPMAGKTGTTDDYRDAWFVGFTPKMITGVWVGYDRPRPGGRGFTGGAVAAPIWERFMRSALAGHPPQEFSQPATVVSVTIDPTTGFLATTGCPEKRDEFYIDGTQPTAYCPKHPGEPIPPVSPRPAAPPENGLVPATPPPPVSGPASPPGPGGPPRFGTISTSR